MSARKVQLVPTPVLAKVEGFEVVTSPFANCLPSPDTVSQHQRPKKSVSLLSLEISTSLSSEAIAFTDEELTDTECYTDDEEEERANSPAAIPIAIKVQDSTLSFLAPQGRIGLGFTIIVFNRRTKMPTR